MSDNCGGRYEPGQSGRAAGRLTALLWAGLLSGLIPSSYANTVVFTTGIQMLAGNAENASAAFDIDDGTQSITIHLLNLQLDPSNVNQAIGSLRFTLTGAGTPTPGATP